MNVCKRCQSEAFVRNGSVRGKQRYRCRECGLNFIEGDARGSAFSLLRKALAVIYYRLSDGPSWTVSDFFGVSGTMIWQWINEFEAKLDKAKDAEMHTGMTAAEVVKYLSGQKDFIGSKKRWVVAKGEVCPGYKAIVIMRREKADEIRRESASKEQTADGKAKKHQSNILGQESDSEVF